MSHLIIGEKIEMSQIFSDEGKVMPVTLIKCGPCYVLQNKTKEKDGYEAIQIGFQKIDVWFKWFNFCSLVCQK